MRVLFGADDFVALTDGSGCDLGFQRVDGQSPSTQLSDTAQIRTEPPHGGPGSAQKGKIVRQLMKPR